MVFFLTKIFGFWTWFRPILAKMVETKFFSEVSETQILKPNFCSEVAKTKFQNQNSLCETENFSCAFGAVYWGFPIKIA